MERKYFGEENFGDQNLEGETKKGHKCARNVGAVTVLFLCTSSYGGLFIFVPCFVKITAVLKLQSGHNFHIKTNPKALLHFYRILNVFCHFHFIFIPRRRRRDRGLSMSVRPSLRPEPLLGNR